jgi:mannose-6-phosphate isomerase-like protein (cupin superfamily)
MYLLEGQGVMVGEQGERPLEPGAVMWVPPYERHQIKNTGSAPLKFICCVPQKP